MWGRGSKHNCGKPELSSSSVGSVKAALTAIDGFNLYGNNGANWSTIYVDPDAFSRNQRTLEALLPRESNSKFTDASLLPTLLWPCFAANRNNKKTVSSLTIVALPVFEEIIMRKPTTSRLSDRSEEHHIR